MSYVNEYINDADISKYGITKLNRRFVWLEVRPQWTRDSERDMYLRVVGEGREEFLDDFDFSFYWHGELILARLRRKFGEKDGLRSISYEMIKLDMDESNIEDREQMFGDLKEALVAYGGAGVLNRSNIVNFEFKF
ncbi:hypothetical protein [Roseateles sp.]|uniref:hypothetical protein n=1 Tax=Roseateles sp. TaxID=1971397 RepID=UPI003267606C